MRIFCRQLKTVLALIGTACFIVVMQITRKSLSRKVFPRSFPVQLSEGSASFCKPKRLPDDLSKQYRMYDGVKAFVMFIGCSATEEGLTEAILDAHPEILLTREYDTIGNMKMYQDKKLHESGQQKYMLFFLMQYVSNFQAIFRESANKPSMFWAWTPSSLSSINYNTIPGTWQEKTDGKLKVVVDASGCSTSKKLMKNDQHFTELKEIQNMLGISLKFIHVVANPFEEIALNGIKKSGSKGQENVTLAFQESIKKAFALAAVNEEVRRRFEDAVLDITTKQLTSQPRQTLKRICDFLEINCGESYLYKVEEFLHQQRTTR